MLMKKKKKKHAQDEKLVRKKIMSVAKYNFAIFIGVSVCATNLERKNHSSRMTFSHPIEKYREINERVDSQFLTEGRVFVVIFFSTMENCLPA